ncbi:MAG TPA: FtsX-like permease family protein, partial [Oceanipulchritudo sp.]|nr:FtsX-like permease family protein [Oceanipulchritudo sp.]
ANVANLLVGRALARGREMAIRSAVGATRGRIIRQLLTESLLLSSFGAVGGLLYAAWAVDATMQSPIYSLPYWMDCELDWRVFVFVLGVMIITALVSGLVPAWQASKIDLNEMLKDTSHTSTSFRLGRLTRMLAVIQIAFSCALLFGAGLIARNVYHMATIEPGYDKDHILTMRMGLFPADYPEETDRDEFYRQLTEKVSKIPGVRTSSVSSWIGQFGNYKEPFLSARENSDKPEMAYVYAESVSPSYFDTFGMKVLKGRGFFDTEADGTAHVAVVNQTFATKLYGNTDPIGRQVSPFIGKPLPEGESARTWEIVGVVPDIRVSDFTKAGEPEPIIYLPYRQTESQFMSLMISAEGASIEDLKPLIQNVILELDPNLPVYFAKTMGQYIEDQIYPYRVMANFFLTIGLMALFLAAIGVYGMLAFNVSRRRREIGIRMALGANTLRIVTQILRQGFVQVVAGLTVGTGLAYLVGQMTRNFLFGINPADPSVYGGVLLTLVGVAILAFFVPARRAARLSPMDALRYE